METIEYFLTKMNLMDDEGYKKGAYRIPAELYFLIIPHKKMNYGLSIFKDIECAESNTKPPFEYCPATGAGVPIKDSEILQKIL